MKRFVLASLAALAMLVFAASASASLLFYADGSRPIAQEWSSFAFYGGCGGTFASGAMPPANQFQVESTFTPPGQAHAYHFTLPDHSPCYTSADRGEINMGNSPNRPWTAPDGTVRDQVQGQNSWIAYWFYIPTNLTASPLQRNVMGGKAPWHGILQWHNYGSGGPPLGVEAFDGGQMNFGEQNCQTLGCSNGGPVRTWSYARDKWLKLVLHVNWSSGPDGYVEAYGDMGDGQGYRLLAPRYTRWILKTSGGVAQPVFPTLGNYEMGCQTVASFCGTSETYALGPFVGTTEADVLAKAYGGGGPPPPPPGFTAAFTGPTASTRGQAVTFDSSTSTGSPVSYQWTDAAAKNVVLGTSANLTFTFNYAGTKKITLTETDASGATSVVEHDLTVS